MSILVSYFFPDETFTESQFAKLQLTELNLSLVSRWRYHFLLLVISKGPLFCGYGQGLLKLPLTAQNRYLDFLFSKKSSLPLLKDLLWLSRLIKQMVCVILLDTHSKAT